MCLSRYAIVALSAGCVLGGVAADYAGATNRFFTIAFCFVVVVVVAYLVAASVKPEIVTGDSSRVWSFRMLPVSTAVVCLMLVLYPWTRVPLDFDSFRVLAPGDTLKAILVRIALAALFTFVTSLSTRAIFQSAIGGRKL